VIAVCERWETLATPIGTVNDSGCLRVLSAGEVVADLPVGILVDDCPLYDLEPAELGPSHPPLYAPAPAVLSGHESTAETLLVLLGSANIASRRPVFEQYDPVVQSRTVRRPDDADAAVLALPTGEAIAVSDRRQTAGASPAIRGGGRPRRSTNAPPTSPVSVPPRSA